MDEKEIQKYLADNQIDVKVLETYKKLYQELISNVNIKQFEPFFAKLNIKNEEDIKEHEKLIEEMRSYMLNELLKSLDDFWKNGDIEMSLAVLEIYKSRCKDYGPEDCEMKSTKRDPVERTRPIRMLIKSKAKQFLEARLKSQNVEIEKAMKTNLAYRKTLTEVIKKRIELKSLMKEHIENFESHCTKTAQITTELLNDIGNGIK